LKKSLQILKNNIAKKEETLKALQNTYPHLAHLSETQLLAYFKVNTMDELKKHIKVIKSSIHHDHPESPSCSCTDSRGQAKDLYIAEEFAQKEAETLTIQKRVKLKVYSCPDGCGWHLAKR
jgi:hypothetical protein